MRRAADIDELLLDLRRASRALRGKLGSVVAARLAPLRALTGEPCRILEGRPRQLGAMRLDACPCSQPITSGDADRRARQRTSDLAPAIKIDGELDPIGLHLLDARGHIALLTEPPGTVFHQ